MFSLPADILPWPDDIFLPVRKRQLTDLPGTISRESSLVHVF